MIPSDGQTITRSHEARERDEIRIVIDTATFWDCDESSNCSGNTGQIPGIVQLWNKYPSTTRAELPESDDAIEQRAWGSAAAESLRRLIRDDE